MKPCSLGLAALCALLVGPPALSWADASTWGGGNGVWEDGSRWVPGGIPTPGADAYLNPQSGEAASVTFGAGVNTVASQTNVHVGDAGLGTMMFSIQGGSLTTWTTVVGSTGSIHQSGGVHQGLTLHVAPGGIYQMSGGNLGFSEDSSIDAGGTLTQIAGLCQFNRFQISGTYALNGGTLTAASLDISSTGLLAQTTGTDNVNWLMVEPSATYRSAGGSLVINSNAIVQGTWDFAGATAIVQVASGATVDLSQADVTGAQNASLTVGTGSLLIVRSGFDPSSMFHTFVNSGAIHISGTTLLVPAGSGIQLRDTFNDPLQLEGSLTVYRNVTLTKPTEFDSGSVVQNVDAGSLVVAGPLAITGGTQTLWVTSIQPGGVITQTGGTQRALGLQVNSGGIYQMRGGNLYFSEDSTVSAAGSVVQSAGAGEFARLHVYGAYRLLGGSVTIDQSLWIESGGTLTLGGSNLLAIPGPTVLDGGTLNTGGFSNTLGVLDISANSYVDLADGLSVLHFLNSSAEAWTGMLAVKHWSGDPMYGGGIDQLFIGSDATGVNAAQLSEIAFAGFPVGARILSTGEVVPVPEPASLALLGLGFAGLLTQRGSRR